MANPFTGGTVNFMPQGTQSIGNPDSTAILRAQQYAQMLRQQAEQPEEYNQVVSGRVVPYSWAQGLAKLGKSYMAGQAEKQSDEMMKNYQQERGKRLAQTLSDYQNALQGTPDKVEEFKPDTFDETDKPFGTTATGQSAPYGGMMLNVTPGTPGSKQSAMQVLMQNPDTAQAALSAELKRMGEVEKFGHTPVTLMQNGKPVTVMMGDLGTVRNLEGYQPQVDFNKPFLPDGSPNPAYQKFEISKSRAGASNVSVNTEKSYAGNVAEGLAKQDVAVIDAARSAPQRVQSARQVKDLLDKNPITGTGAEARLSLNKALATAGLIGGEQVKNTETLASVLANQTLDAIKTSGLGSGQGFTDKDRQFLERAKSGNLEVNAGTLRQLADLNERAALSSIDRGNQIIGKLRQNPTMGNVGVGLDTIDVPKGAPNLQDAVAAELLRRGIK